MPHHAPLIGTIVAGLVTAFLLGALAHRLRISPIVGYLLAGVAVGPFTPGIVADSNLAAQLAEIGVILLMFGVGLHFSLRDLLSVRRISLPGAIAQISVATLMGMVLAESLGWPLLSGFVFGLALSTASTVVLLRALEGRNLVETERGRIAIGWLIVEDLAMVLALVLLPAIAMATRTAESVTGPALLAAITTPILVTILKVTAFMALMLIIGRWLIPRALHWVVHTGSRELFRLSVLAIALGVAFGAALVFNVSFALGAFFAGMILGETRLSRRAAEETLPLRDAFAVLFFVSVGMLFDPRILTEQPGPLLATVAIIVFGKSIVAFIIVRAFGHGNRTAFTVSASLAQIGEFSFILAGLGAILQLLPTEGRDLILAGAIISICLNPLVFWVASRAAPDEEEAESAPPEDEPAADSHTILVGYGRVGRMISATLRGRPGGLVVVETDRELTERAEKDGLRAVTGNATQDRVLEEAGIGQARKLLIALPEGFEGAVVAQRARQLNPALAIIAHAHSEAGAANLRQHGVDRVVMEEEEAARRMSELALSFTVPSPAKAAD